MGRPEKELDPAAGPVQGLAAGLRKLRAEAGGPTYRAMALRAGFSAPTLSAAAAGERLPSLPVLRAYVTACGASPREWERRWYEVSEELGEQFAAADDEPSPYPGLARFGSADQAHFHGREELTARLVRLALNRPLTVVIGASGSGKSSLLHAGLVPALRAGQGSPDGYAAIRVLTPGRRPARTHRAHFTPGAGRTLLVVDQFEEVYTLCHDPAERRAFLDLLLSARDRSRRLSAVLAVRADFSGHCAEYAPFAEAVRDAALLVGPLTPYQLRQAVVRPAGAQQMIVERALTARIVADADGEPGGLPLMAHALREVWRRRSGRRLTEAAYDAIGGVHGAVAHTAEETWTGFAAAEADAARALLLRLVAPGDGTPDTRRRVRRTELPTSPVTVRTLEGLIAARLLTADGDEVELAHEALLTAWPRLRGWIEEDRERLRRHRRLTEAAQAWLELERDPGALYRGVRLALARESFPDGAGLSDGERAFLAAGVEESRREERGARRAARRLRGLTGLLAALLVIAVLAGAAAWRQSGLTEERRDESEARRIAAVADTLRTTDPRTALRLGVAAYRIADLPETRAAVRSGAGQRDQDLFAPAYERLPSGPSLLSADGRVLAMVGRDRLLRWDIATRRQIGDDRISGLRDTFFDLAPDTRSVAIRDGEDLMLRLLPGGRAVRVAAGADGIDTGSFSPDGRLFVVGFYGGLLQVRDARTGRTLFHTRDARTGGGPGYAVTDDSRLVAWCTGRYRLAVHDLTGGAVRPPPGDLARAACGASDITFTPDGRAFAVPTRDGVRTWDLRSGRERPRVPVRDARGLSFSGSGRWVATLADDTVRVWRTSAPGRPVYIGPPVSRSAMDLRIDERAGVVRHREGSSVVAVRTLSLGGALEGAPRLPPARKSLLSPDGRRTVRHENGRLTLRDTHGGVPVRELPGRVCADCRPVSAFSPGGDVLAYTVGGAAGELRVVTAADGRSLWTGRLPGRVDSLAVEPDGAQVTVSSVGAVNRDNDRWRVSVWQVDRDGARRVLAADTSGSESLLAPDRRAVLTADGRVHPLGPGGSRAAAPGEDHLSSAAFSADGRFLAVGDILGRVTLWSRATGERLAVLVQEEETGPGAGPDARPALAFSSDGALVAVGSRDGSVRVWETAAPRLAGAVPAVVSGPVQDLALVDGRVRVATADASTLSYGLSPPALARAVCARSGELTRRQWEAYLPGLPFRSTC
ncbi:nSTAND1 domain-containing NTPase [Streptomyces uncialis]|uniref:nSTAND1 domain-containing NTPase n=1 Tax=Streptomyces uncialis TaxID=1048205 RepID=UPI00340E4739